MADEEVELSETSRDDYEVIPITPIRRLEKRISEIEQAGSIPQLQTLITQIIELIKSNQRIVDEVINANSELRNEISKLPAKIDDLTTTMKSFISLVEAAGREEITAPGPEALKPLVDQFQKVVEQNQKLLESNQAMVEQLDNINRKLKTGTPVSQLLSAYPGIKLGRKEV